MFIHFTAECKQALGNQSVRTRGCNRVNSCATLGCELNCQSGLSHAVGQSCDSRLLLCERQARWWCEHTRDQELVPLKFPYFMHNSESRLVPAHKIVDVSEHYTRLSICQKVNATRTILDTINIVLEHQDLKSAGGVQAHKKPVQTGQKVGAAAM